MTEFPDFSLGILAGGDGTRLGNDNKAFVRLRGVPIIGRTVEKLRGMFGETLILANNPRAYSGFARKATVVEDTIRDAGPLEGLRSALSSATKGAVFLVACDMPFLNIRLIRRQLVRFRNDDVEALVPRIGENIEPLHAVYRTCLKDRLHSFLSAGTSRSIRSFLITVDTGYWDLDGSPSNIKAFFNINTPEDYERMMRMVTGQQGARRARGERKRCKRTLGGQAQ